MLLDYTVHIYVCVAKKKQFGLTSCLNHFLYSNLVLSLLLTSSAYGAVAHVIFEHVEQTQKKCIGLFYWFSNSNFKMTSAIVLLGLPYGIAHIVLQPSKVNLFSFFPSGECTRDRAREGLTTILLCLQYGFAAYKWMRFDSAKEQLQEDHGALANPQMNHAWTINHPFWLRDMS